MYHGITESNYSFPCWWQLPKNKFLWQIEYLNKHYTVLPLIKLLSLIKDNKPIPNNVAVITFDDGFENNYKIAFPILFEFKMPATIFLTTDLIGTNKNIWIDELWMHFANTKKSAINLSKFNLGVMSLLKDDKNQSFNKISSWIKKQDFNKKNEILEYLKNELANKGAEFEYAQDFHLLSWTQVDDMKRSGLINFGAHTCTHEILSRLDDQRLNYEIINSCNTIAQHSQEIVFAYPNGKSYDYDERSINLLKNANVLCALTTTSGLNSHKNDLFHLKRISIGNDITNDFFESYCSGILS